MLKPLILTAALAVALPATAEPLNYNVMSFSESAHSEVERDTMSVVFTINEEGKDRTTVGRNFANKFNRFNREADSRNLKTVLLSRNAQPSYTYQNGKRTQSGWRESARIKIDSQDFTRMNKLIADSQAYTGVGNVYFYVSKAKREKVVDTISQAALLRFKERASMLSRTLGFNGYKIVNLDLGDVGNMQVRYAQRPQSAMMLMKTESLSDSVPAVDTTDPGTEDISITVRGTIQM